MRRLNLGLLLFVATMSTSACSECNSEGCIDGVEVRFREPLDAALAFSVFVEADTETIQCDYDRGQELDSCSSAGVWVQESGGEITGFILHSIHPQQLTFSFSANGTVLVRVTATPDYHVETPNGSQCPPTCRNAVVEA